MSVAGGYRADLARIHDAGFELHRLRLLRASELAAELRDAGFRARVPRRLGELDLPGGMRVLVARKT